MQKSLADGSAQLDLVKWSPPLPGPRGGQRFTCEQLIGSADSAVIAQQVTSHRKEFSVMLVLCANALDAARLAEEIPIFAPALKVRLLPDWEILPYDAFSPHQDLVSERLATLHEMLTGACDIVLIPITTALQKLAPPQFLAAHTFFFKKGDTLNEQALRHQLQEAGYDPVTAVVRPGEYSIRGGLIDLFPMGSALPYRIDLFGNEIDQIRSFDPDSQRSLFPVAEIRLLPGHEFPLDEAARTAFRGRWREIFEGDPSKCSIYKDIGNGIPSAGIESYLPLFFESTATVLDYLPTYQQPAWIGLHGELESAMKNFWHDTSQRYKFLSHDPARPVLPPKDLYLQHDELFALIKPYPRLELSRQSNLEEKSGFQNLPPLAVNRKEQDPIHLLREFIHETKQRVVISADSAGRRETIKQLLSDNQLTIASFESLDSFLTQNKSKHGLIHSPLHDGFISSHGDIAIVTESELFAQTARNRRKNKDREASNVDTLVKDLSELKVGDPVVHAEHGIGRYQGLIMLDMGSGEEEFLHLLYAHAAALYVPVSQLQLISRYSGADPETAPLHQLGSGQWEKAKRKAAQQIRDTAAELLNLYAARATRQGHAFEFSAHDYEAFADSFGFEETADQAAAIAAVISDMTSGKPMDRLVCGDVGFGKTEVALRASFLAVMGGKQVAILAPTTLLAEQHVETWKDRFANWPVKIVELSRFKTAKEINAALQAVAKGDADIVIGTHKLLSGDIEFPRLGLVIIDEEHRFGVRQKETLKAMRSEVDVLTLTATPIPRTLGMAMEGLRDFSVIATAPQKRLAIKTFVRREGDAIIREAVLREIKRGGQVYFLHNEVDTIENRRQALEQLLPEARIVVAHGQMHERDLERVMRDFVSQRANLLLCTTIIETGIDVPTANTIIIHRADKFGLAQLHQLRGRVGRSHHQAYAYLTVPDPEALTKQAKMRLDAIQAMEELGSGFYLAMHDLEIRGAGEVLGDKQSGDISEIGFQLYTDMLNKAIKSLKNGQEPDLMAPMNIITDISLGVPALLPSDYCPDVHERLSIYKRLSGMENEKHLTLMHEELVDRFGQLPEPAQALLEIHRLRLQMTRFGIRKLDAYSTHIHLQFKPNPPIDPLKIIQLIQTNRQVQLNGQDKLKIVPTDSNAFGALPQRLEALRQLFQYLGQPLPTTS